MNTQPIKSVTRELENVAPAMTANDGYPTLRPAHEPDIDYLLDLMEALYSEDGNVAFNRQRHRRAALALLTVSTAGQVFIVEAAAIPVGYAVVTWGYSLEFGGADAFLDEMYVHPDYRRQGLGRRLLAAVEELCLKRGVEALHLEVERANLKAQRLYRDCGFADHDRYLMTRSIGQHAQDA